MPLGDTNEFMSQPKEKPKKKLIVRWTAVYETVIEVPAFVSPDYREAQDAAARIPIDCPGSTYQTDTWEVERIMEKADADALDNNE